MKELDRQMRNLYVLGVACNLNIFPVDAESIKKALKATVKKGMEKQSLQVFESALKLKKTDKQEV